MRRLEEIRDRHRADARAQLLRARHYARFFGAPVSSFSAQHNQARAEVNDRRVRAHAVEAGRFARYGDLAVEELHVLASVAVGREIFRDQRIVEGIVHGWSDTDELIGGWDRRHGEATHVHGEEARRAYCLLLRTPDSVGTLGMSLGERESELELADQGGPAGAKK